MSRTSRIENLFAESGEFLLGTRRRLLSCSYVSELSAVLDHCT